MSRIKVVVLGSLVITGGILLMLGGWLGMRGPAAPAEHSVTKGTGPRPNVVLIVVDALRADRVGASRNGQPLTPFLDEFSRAAAVFEHAVTACTWTRPSIASLFTSLHVDTHQVYFDNNPDTPEHPTADALSKDLETAAEFLREQGYRTAGVQTNGNLKPLFGFDQGFDTYEYLADAPGAAITNMALNTLETLSGPFFMYVHYIDPHLPYIPPDTYRKLLGWPPAISPEEMAIVTDGFIEYLWDYMNAATGRKSTSYTPLSDEAKEAVRLLYDAEVRYADDEMRRFVSELQSRFPDTYIIITADHGEELWDHNYLGHGLAMYEETLRVPLIIAGPGIAPGRFPQTVSLVDLLPTMATWLQLPPRPFWQGRDVFAPPPETPRPFFSYTEGPWPGWNTKKEMVLVGNEKLIANRINDTVELFDVIQDPPEQHNFSKDRPEQVKAFLKLLDEHRDRNIRARQSVRTRTVVDAETLEQQRILGYGHK